MLISDRGIFKSFLMLAMILSAARYGHAGVLDPAFWADGSTDPAGNYFPFAPLAVGAGNAVRGFIPTDSNPAFPDNEVTNYFRTSTALAGAAYDGVLLGDLSGAPGLTATFSLFNSALPLGAPFGPSQIVGETYPGQVGNNAAIRLMFMGGYLSDGTPNEWWFDPGPAYVTSMKNGQAITLNATFDPSLWSNYYAKIGSSDTAEFAAALSGVTRLGLSFGSGYFFSDGFGFNTGGTAYIQLDSIQATPEPATLGFVAFGLISLVAVTIRRSL